MFIVVRRNSQLRSHAGAEHTLLEKTYSPSFALVHGKPPRDKSPVSPQRVLDMRQGSSARRLTDRYLQTVTPPSTGRLEILDAEAPGLVLRVTPNGVRSWAIRYRLKGQAQRRATFGSYPAVSLSDARTRAKTIAAAAAHGTDLLAREAHEAAERRAAAGRPVSVADLLDRYVEDHCLPNQRRGSLTERLFVMHVKPAIGEILLSALRRADVVEMLDDLQNRKGLRAQVNRVRSQVVAALNWAVEREWIETNPASTIRRRKLEAPRERVLSHEELRAVWYAADTLSDPGRSYVKALILTGQRRDEIRCMRWDEISGSLWTLPKERNKGKRDHALPLAPALIEVLEQLPKAGPFVFTVNQERPYAGLRRLKEILDRKSRVTGWVLHDIRRTVRSGLSELHISEEVAERVLNHAQKGLGKVYDRHSYINEMRIALDAWAKHVAFIVGLGEEGENVVPIRAL